MAHGNTQLARRLLWIAAYVNVSLLCMLCSLASLSAGWLWSCLLLLAVDASVSVYALKQGLFFELRQERTWKAVCSGLGGSFVGGKTRLHANPFWVFGGSLMQSHEQKMFPKLRQVHGTVEQWIGIVIPFAGQTIADYTNEADAFALAFHVPSVTFGIAENGLIRLRAGHVPIPEAYDYPGQQVIHQIGTNTPTLLAAPPVLQKLPALTQEAPTLAYERELLKNVPMARDLNGQVWHMPIEGHHVFIAARTGGGKGSWIWSLVLGLAPAWQAGLVTFSGCDPKRLELAIGRDYWKHYADTAEDIVALLEQCVHEMHERANTLQGKVRKFTPNKETPLVIIVVDEMGYITSMIPDKKLRARAEDAIATILSQGRAVGYALVGAVQDPRKETISSRDLFSIRIAGGLPGPMVDLVLGDGMQDAGALCNLIPLGNAGAGVGYVISETSLQPLCVRAAWCGDEAIQEALLESTRNTTGIREQPNDEPPIEQLDWNGQPL